ncbi:MAG: allantoinase AllB [Acidobacteria bacterium]|nr:allantoinase AllB [Acidobacteriota bacterium]
MTPDLVVRGHRVVTPAGVRPAAVHIQSGKIVALATYDEIPRGAPVFDAGQSVVMPGLVDTHVHINEPGRIEWEGFDTATRAAAAGGVTTLIEMPLNSIPATTTRAALKAKIEAAQGQCHVDVGFWGGVVPGNVAELRPLWEAGAFGFKCFLVPSGVPEFEPVAELDLRQALPELASLGAVLLAHSELPAPIAAAAPKIETMAPRRYSTWLASRPRGAENQAIALLLRLSREFGARLHVVHLSSSDALPMLRQAREDGLPVTVETCHHYLTFSAEEIPDGATEFKCAPPLRERENQEKLWAALGEGLIDFVATDHSPCPPAMKCGDSGDFLRAWGGISSLQLSLPALWTQARARGFGLEQMAEWLCQAPARLAGLDKRRGSIAVGYDADLVVWNPEAAFEVAPEQLHHRHKLTPYRGRTLYGKVEATFLRGEIIYEGGRFGAAPRGAVLRRQT